MPGEALNPTKTSISKRTQNVQHRWDWRSCRWEGWQGTGCHWRRLAPWASRVRAGRQHLVSCCSRCLQHPSPVCCQASMRLPTPASEGKREEGSNLRCPLPCREEGVDRRGVLTLTPTFVLLHVSLACTAPSQCVPLARVTAPCSPSPPRDSRVGFCLLDAGQEPEITQISF